MNLSVRKCTFEHVCLDQPAYSSSLSMKGDIFIPRHTTVAGYYGFTLDVRVSVCQSYGRPSVFRFRMITLNINGFSPNLVCALILWRSGLGLLIPRSRQEGLREY